MSLSSIGMVDNMNGTVIALSKSNGLCCGTTGQTQTQTQYFLQGSEDYCYLLGKPMVVTFLTFLSVAQASFKPVHSKCDTN